MPDPRLATLTSENGRTYTHPITREEHVSSTTVLKLMPKQLTGWAGDEAAGAAWDNRQWLMQMTSREQAIAAFGRASDRTRNQAGDHGRLVHKGCELLAMSYAGWALTPEQTATLSTMLLGQQGYAVQQGVLRFAEFWRTYVKEPLFLEQTVWGNGWAGTFDWILLLIDGRIALVDGKSNKAIYRDPKVQLSSYWGAPVIINAEGVETPMPHIDVCAVLHLPQAGGYRFLDMEVNQRDLDRFERLLEDWYYEQDVPLFPGVPIPVATAPGRPGARLCGAARSTTGSVRCIIYLDDNGKHEGDHHGRDAKGSRHYYWGNTDAPGAAASPPFADAGQGSPNPPALRPVPDVQEGGETDSNRASPLLGSNVQGGGDSWTEAAAPLHPDVPEVSHESGSTAEVGPPVGSGSPPAQPYEVGEPGRYADGMFVQVAEPVIVPVPELDQAEAHSAKIAALFTNPGGE